MALLGQVQIVYQSDPNDPGGVAEEFDPGDAGNPLPGFYVIRVNSTSSGNFLAAGSSEAANTIIHELLHVAFAMGYAVNPAWVQGDGLAADAERTNNNLIVTNCGVGTLIP